MAVTVKLPTQLRAAAGGAAEAQADGSTVGEVLDALYGQHGELRDRLAGEDGELRRFVNVYVKGRTSASSTAWRRRWPTGTR